MNSNELRIGNYFQWSAYASMGIGVGRITHGQQIMDYINLKEPIPITSEWLERFGFKKNDNNELNDHFYSIPVGGSLLNINPDNGVAWITRLNPKNDINRPGLVIHVHQLQNLYYALTDKELQLTSEKKATD